MKTQQNTIILEDSIGFSPTPHGVNYTDISGTRIHIPISLLVRLYEGTKEHMERKGVDWVKFCDSLFNKEKK